MKKYLVDGKIYHFDIVEKHQFCYFAKCVENGKFAWLDEENGIQFEGERRFIAEPYTKHEYGVCVLWGGEFRPKYNWQKSPVRNRF